MIAGQADQNRFPSAYAVELVDLHLEFLAVVPGRVAMERIPEFIGSAFAEVLQVLDEEDLAPAGPPFGRWEPRDNGYVVTGQPWESYLDQPDAAEPRTQVYLPCARAPKG